MTNNDPYYCCYIMGEDPEDYCNRIRKETMNANATKDFEAAHEIMGLIEIVDADGNPTGEYVAEGIGEATSEETAYLAEKHPDHVVTIH